MFESDYFKKMKKKFKNVGKRDQQYKKLRVSMADSSVELVTEDPKVCGSNTAKVHY